MGTIIGVTCDSCGLEGGCGVGVGMRSSAEVVMCTCGSCRRFVCVERPTTGGDAIADSCPDCGGPVTMVATGAMAGLDGPVRCPACGELAVNQTSMGFWD